MRVAGGVLCALVFLGAMYFVTLAETSVECSVCVSYNGRNECTTASAGDRNGAIAQALSSACAGLSSGVTQVMECNRTPPVSTRCSE